VSLAFHRVVSNPQKLIHHRGKEKIKACSKPRTMRPVNGPLLLIGSIFVDRILLTQYLAASAAYTDSGVGLA